MHHNTSVSRALRACVLGLATVTAAVVFTADTADARRHRHHRHHARHHVSAPSYNPAFASIIVDGNSGAILSANNPDSLRHPASLTKIMTLYMLFERLEAGKLSLDSQMEVSEHASIQAPTKLGLRPGQTLRVEDAIKALVTRSANDAAVVIAEAIAGDEDSFARMMTKKARALGMSRTVYRNASGLPDIEQVTSARDMATLGLRLTTWTGVAMNLVVAGAAWRLAQRPALIRRHLTISRPVVHALEQIAVANLKTRHRHAAQR